MKKILGRMGRMGRMWRFGTVLILGLAFLPMASAQSLPVFSLGGTAAPEATTNPAKAYVVIPGVEGSQARLQYLNVTGDTPSAGVTIYQVMGAPISITNTAAAGATNVGVASVPWASGWLWTNGLFVLKFQNGPWQRLNVQTNTAVQISFKQGFATNVLRDDKLYLMTPVGRLPVGDNGTSYKEVGLASGLWFGQPGQPVLVELLANGSNTFRINLATGDYVK